MNSDLHFDYTTVGHVTVDAFDDGSRQLGGTAFYSALQAARLGRRALIVTQGSAEEIEELLAPYRGELEVAVTPAAQTTTLQTSGMGISRRQRVLAWAGPMGQELQVDTSILHLAPVARETPGRWRGAASFVGLTPQGLVRQWSDARGEISLPAPIEEAGARGARGVARAIRAPEALDLAARCDAIVVNEQERASCAELIATSRRAGAVVAITAGPGPNTILLPEGGVLEPAVPALEDPCDDLGAGDVFAAAFFVALADGRHPEQAASLANAAAAVRMQGTGPDAIGGLAAIEARMRGEQRPGRRWLNRRGLRRAGG